jgi:hypothetical protein
VSVCGPCRVLGIREGRLPHEASADNLKLATGSHERRRDTGAELDVVDVKVDVEADGYVVLRMTWRQHKAYLHGSFTPGYPGELQNMGAR